MMKTMLLALAGAFALAMGSTAVQPAPAYADDMAKVDCSKAENANDPACKAGGKMMKDEGDMKMKDMGDMKMKDMGDMKGEGDKDKGDKMMKDEKSK